MTMSTSVELVGGAMLARHAPDISQSTVYARTQHACLYISIYLSFLSFRVSDPDLAGVTPFPRAASSHHLA